MGRRGLHAGERAALGSAGLRPEPALLGLRSGGGGGCRVEWMSEGGVAGGEIWEGPRQTVWEPLNRRGDLDGV